jgi:hypothetical protein
MTTTPTSLSPTPALTDEGTLESAIDCLTSNLEINMSGGYTVRDLFEILVRTASRGEFMMAVIQILATHVAWHRNPVALVAHHAIQPQQYVPDLKPQFCPHPSPYSGGEQ